MRMGMAAITNGYVILSIGIVSVRYRRMENSAKRPNPVPMESSMLVKSPMMKEMTVEKARKVKT